MLLKPMSTNVFYAALAVSVVTMASLGLSEAVFEPLFARPGVQDFLRQVVAPILVG